MCPCSVSARKFHLGVKVALEDLFLEALFLGKEPIDINWLKNSRQMQMSGCQILV